MRPRHSQGARSLRASSSTPASPASRSATARTATTAIPASVNAWVRVYEEDALGPPPRADERLARGRARPSSAGSRSASRISTPSPGSRSPPRAACSTRCRTATATPGRASRPRGWCCSVTCTRTSSPRRARPTRSAIPGRSSARPAARAAAPAAALASRHGAGRDRHRHRRLAPHPLGDVRDVDDQADPRRSSRSAGSCPLSPTLRPCRADGPHRARLRAAARRARRRRRRRASRRPLERVAVSPRIADLDPDVADGLRTRARGAPGRARRAAAAGGPARRLEPSSSTCVCTEMLVWHRRFDDRRERLPPVDPRLPRARRERAMTGEEYVAAQAAPGRGHGRLGATGSPSTGSTRSSSRRSRSSRPRAGSGYDEAFTDYAEISLTHYWDWTGFPVVALPSGRRAAGAGCRSASR